MSGDPLWDDVRSRLADDDWWARRTPDEAGPLRSALLERFRDLETQLAAAKADREAFRQECFAEGDTGKAKWFASEGEYNAWRRSALHFHRLVSRRLSQMRAMERRDVQQSTRSAAEVRNAVRRLAQGIAAHQDATDDVRPQDLRLWGLLEAIYLPLGAGEANLATLVDDVWHRDDDTPE